MTAARPDGVPIRLPADARCDGCGYDLRGLTNARCPECGRSFDPASMWAASRGEHVRRPFDAAAAERLRPPPWWATAVVLVGPAISLSRGLPTAWDQVGPGVPELAAIGIGCATLLSRLRGRARTFRDVVVPADRMRVRGRNWAVLPTAIVVAFVCTCSGWGRAQLVFQLSRRSADRLAAEVAVHGDVPDRRVGLIAAHAIRPTPDGMNLRVADNFECGFAHTTTGRPPGRYPEATRLGGGWYAFGFPD